MAPSPNSSLLCQNSDDGLSDIEAPIEVSGPIYELVPCLTPYVSSSPEEQGQGDRPKSPPSAKNRRKASKPKKNRQNSNETRFKTNKIRPGLAGLSQRFQEEQKRQNKTLLLPKSGFSKLVREIARMMKEDIRFQSKALEALQEASEAFLTRIFEDSNLCCIHANRVTLFPSDMKLALRLAKHNCLSN